MPPQLKLNGHPWCIETGALASFAISTDRCCLSDDERRLAGVVYQAVLAPGRRQRGLTPLPRPEHRHTPDSNENSSSRPL